MPVIVFLVVAILAGYYFYRKKLRGIPVYSYEVIKVYPHDRNAYTQGLVYRDGVLYESTGVRGQSSVRVVDLQSGRVLRQRRLDDRYFGEAIALCGDKLIQLTWQSHVGFVYDPRDFQVLEKFVYPMQGWGLTFDGQRLIISDGSATLYFLDPKDFHVVGQVEVRAQGRPVKNLNELEYINGRVYANIWHSEKVAVIVPETGKVESWVDLHGLLSLDDYRRPVDVLNGIAYDKRRDCLLVTGKLWPKLFAIRLVR